jgi:ABC-type taurine transport system ATPase subunit
VLLDGAAPVLLEEPELSLHTAVVRFLPQMLARLGRKSGRQVIVTTHSADLLADPGIAAEEVVMLTPTDEGTVLELASSKREIRALVAGGDERRRGRPAVKRALGVSFILSEVRERASITP